MQKDYIRRTTNKRQSAAEPPSPASSTHSSGHRHRYLPSRQGTVGSVKDNTGKEVIGDRVILYIHGEYALTPKIELNAGGAFFFSSLDTHRYQVQRHARKAGARAFCPAYRLSPQYPFVSSTCL